MTKLLPFCAFLLLSACAGSAPQPASAPPSTPTVAQPQPAGAAETQGSTAEHDQLRVELAIADAALADLGKRLEAAPDDAKGEVRQQVASLQKREDDLKAQLSAVGALADAQAESARREIHRGIMALKVDMMQLTDRIPR